MKRTDARDRRLLLNLKSHFRPMSSLSCTNRVSKECNEGHASEETLVMKERRWVWPNSRDYQFGWRGSDTPAKAQEQVKKSITPKKVPKTRANRSSGGSYFQQHSVESTERTLVTHYILGNVRDKAFKTLHKSSDCPAAETRRIVLSSVDALVKARVLAGYTKPSMSVDDIKPLWVGHCS